MPVGNVLGEFTYQATTVTVTDLGGGRNRAEINLVGEATGAVPGKLMSTLILEGNGPGRPQAFTGTGFLFAADGAVIRFSTCGAGTRTGVGHKSRYFGTVSQTTEAPQLAAFNNLIAATEFAADPITLAITGVVCEWK